MSLINLLPQDYYQRRQGVRTNVMCVVLFVVVMGCIVSASMVSRYNASQTQAIMDNLNRSYSQAAQTISQMQTLRGQKQTILDKRRKIESLQDPVPKSIVLAVLTNARPDGVSLLHVKLGSRFDPPDSATRNPTVNTTKDQTAAVPPRRSEPKVTVEIIGLAQTDLQVAHYLANLTDSGLTQSVDLSYTQDYEPSGQGSEGIPKHLQGLREFRLKCRLNKKIDATSMADRWRNTERQALSINLTPHANKDPRGKPVRNVPGTQK
jgi:Tfp pilus assembly protein PilN